MSHRTASATRGDTFVAVGHAHRWQPFPSDPRFERCACGAVRRPDRISDNPCVQLYGRGPEGAMCGGCTHHETVTEHYDTWGQCRLYPKHGYHRQHGPLLEACARFEPKANPRNSQKDAGDDHASPDLGRCQAFGCADERAATRICPSCKMWLCAACLERHASYGADECKKVSDESV